MQNFEWVTPTKVIFGSKILEKLGKETAGIGKRALFLYGKESIKKSGLYVMVVAQLKGEGVFFVEHGGVQPNPRISHAEEGARKIKENHLDVIVAVGGGSVIDEAKAIAVAGCHEEPLWDFYMRKISFEKALPIVAVQTLPATSSELNGASVMTNETTHEKFSIRSETIYPKVSFLDPSLTLDIPVQYTAYACTDILSHLMEGYFTASSDFPLQDGMVEGVCRAVMGALEIVLTDPRNLEARSTIMWAAALAWNGILKSGVEGASIPNHVLEHPLSGFYDVPHGAGLSIVIPAWLKYMKPSIAHRIVLYGERVMGLGKKLEGKTPPEGADIVIKELENWYRHIHTPVRLKEAGIISLDIDACTKQAMALSVLWGVPGYDAEDIRAIYALMN
ncbi:NADH-dependent butanol dehydrogenase a [uncultured spirochete]|uniref:NADH-dependent butanol dehydrogenase a n=1 Tax=uncultured spirochete TaxID=156406 RepID=A0A3P3XRK4_9SPIR|nr:NADH-dependent butanol dehydrogenase a [uncultured spirochete]